MPVIGTIADDYTGATDVALAFRRGGLRTLLFFEVPAEPVELPPHDAVVVALKSRMLPADKAVAQSLAALEWLQSRGAGQFYFKYCSTFDSTPRGNIGPVLDALSGALSVPKVVTTPSSPEHGRTQYKGNLFVGDVPLSESPMRNHPLTPMTDSNLVRLLQAQTRQAVGLLPHEVVRQGEAALRSAIGAHSDRYVLADAISDEDINVLGRALVGDVLTAGAAGLATGLAAAHPANWPMDRDDSAGRGAAVALAGSCSARTLEQVAAMQAAGRPSYLLDPVANPDAEALAVRALAWYDGLLSGDGALIYSSMAPEELHRTQEALGIERSAEILERAVGLIARGLAERGVKRLVVAGGETAGAVVMALGVRGGTIGAEAAAGVPWILPVDEGQPSLLLKSGNFGEPDLLVKATAVSA